MAVCLELERQSLSHCEQHSSRECESSLGPIPLALST